MNLLVAWLQIVGQVIQRHHRLLLGVAITMSVALSVIAVWYHAFVNTPYDWRLFAAVPDRLAQGDLYTPRGLDPGWRWSPVAAWAMVPIVTLGHPIWALAHLGALWLLPRRLMLATLVFFPFWVDVAAGNAFTFVYVAAALAVRKSTPAAVVFIGLSLLMPRPLQLPLVAYLLVTNPGTRVPAAALFALHAIAVVASGYADDWLVYSLTAGSEIAQSYNAGPSALIGPLWVVIGVPVGVLLLLRGWPAWSGLLISPYLLPQYWLFAFVDTKLEQLWARLTPESQEPRYESAMGHNTEAG